MATASAMLSPDILKVARQRERRVAWQQTRIAWLFIAPAVIMVSAVPAAARVSSTSS